MLNVLSASAEKENVPHIVHLHILTFIIVLRPVAFSHQINCNSSFILAIDNTTSAPTQRLQQLTCALLGPLPIFTWATASASALHPQPSVEW